MKLLANALLAITIGLTLPGVRASAENIPEPAPSSDSGTRFILQHMMPSPVPRVVLLHNPLHTAMQSDLALFMPFLSTGSLRIAEACTLPAPNYVGPAGIWIETEHSTLTLREVEDIVIFCHAIGLAPVVRVKKNDVDLFKQVLDLGAIGIVIPQIHDKDDASRAIRGCLYPPDGNRPAGVGRASGYFTQFSEYKKTANSTMSVILMVETQDCVRNINSILPLMRPNKDMLWIGPYDLAQDMKVEIGSKEHAAAIETVEKAAAAACIKLGGNASSLSQAQEMFKRGYRAFTYGDPPEATLAKSSASFFQTK